MKELLEIMFTGWRLHEQSWDGERYTRDDIECMIEACGGDKLKGELLVLFSYWGNDIQSVAAHYGVGYNGPIEKAPSEEHWWDFENAVWRLPLKDNDKVEI